ncbi:hypothetical protein ACHAXM_007922 [Skeletonema potamos]
MINSAVKE